MVELPKNTPETEAHNPAIERLSGIMAQLQGVLSTKGGKNPEWDNLVLNKVTVLESAIQTIRRYGDLPEGMSLKSLEDSVKKLIGKE